MTKPNQRIAQFRNATVGVIMSGGLAVRPGALLTAAVTRDVELAVQAGRLVEVEAADTPVEKKDTAPAAKKTAPPAKKTAPADEPPAGDAPDTTPGPSGVPMEQPKA